MTSSSKLHFIDVIIENGNFIYKLRLFKGKN